MSSALVISVPPSAQSEISAEPGALDYGFGMGVSTRKSARKTRKKATKTRGKNRFGDRAAIDRPAEIVRRRRYELSVWMIWEMGKNRIEALGEIEETADLLTYYADQMRANDGFVREMGKLVPTDHNTSVLRPYGVWAVIAPW